MTKTTFLLFLMLLSVTYVIAQVNSDKYRLQVKESVDAIILDGELNEQSWITADKADNFITTFPEDSLLATSQTAIMITYDQENIYVAGICYVGSAKTHVVQSLKRDFNWGANDNLSIYFDPYNDYTNGFMFGITPLGVVREGLLVNGQQISTDWDNKWFSEVKDFGDRWQFEMRIPYKTIRYNDELEAWNLIVLRKDLKHNEESNWAPVPQGYNPSNLAFSGKMIFDKKLKKAGTNIAFIPFVTAGKIKDFEESDNDDDNFAGGFDAKIGLTSSLNLDLTYNPDFSQVEVDRQVTNLSRFEIFFPERRQFFLENKDLFDQGGFFGSRPFFSRRIGIGSDTAGNPIQVPIMYGARVSGKIGKDWRVGLLNMQTEGLDTGEISGVKDIEGAYKLLPQNYSVGIIQRQIFGRSNIGITAVNRQALNYTGNESIATTTEYNRVVGIDYNILTADNKWEGDIFHYRSFDEAKPQDAFATGAFGGYNSRNLKLRALTHIIGAGYNAEVGFVPRKDIVELGTFNDYDFYPEKGKVVRHGPGMGIRWIGNTEMERTDFSYNVDYNINFENTSQWTAGFGYDYVKLRDDFDPTSVSDTKLLLGEDFGWRWFFIGYNTDRRKLLNGDVGYNDGGFYNGKRRNVNGSVSYRFQPYGQISVDVNYNNLYDFPEPFKNVDFWLISPRLDVTFTKKLFLTTFVQYNEQAENFNVNARLQWRFKPVSDVFLVYTDNYFADTETGYLQVSQPKNRSIVLKATYWLNF